MAAPLPFLLAIVHAGLSWTDVVSGFRTAGSVEDEMFWKMGARSAVPPVARQRGPADGGQDPVQAEAPRRS